MSHNPQGLRDLNFGVKKDQSEKFCWHRESLYSDKLKNEKYM